MKTNIHSALSFNSSFLSTTLIAVLTITTPTLSNAGNEIGVNTSYGQNAFQSNSTGTNDSAFGAFALYSNTTGIWNTATGLQALYTNNGNYNTAVGGNALFYNTSGNSNTATGLSALQSNTSASNNTANGFKSLYSNTTGANNTAQGAQALYFNTTGNNNTAQGFSALGFNKTGKGNAAYGRSALANNTLGNNNTALGYLADVTLNNLSNATAIGYGAKVNLSNKVRIGNAAVTVIEGQVPWTTTSDKRLKNHIADLPLGLDFITKLHPVEYIRNNNAAKTKEWGVIAQELQQTLKEVGYKEAGVVSEESSAEKYLTVRYNDLQAPMIKAIQEQQKTIAALLKRIEALEKK
jgi:trimeric autotransporter adhesin